MTSLKHIIVPLAVAVVASSAFAQAVSPSTTRNDTAIRQEQNEVQADKTAVDSDKSRFNTDQGKLADVRRRHAEDQHRLDADRKAGNKDAIRADEARLKEDEQEIKALNNDESRAAKEAYAKRAAMTRDQKELRQDGVKPANAAASGSR